MHAVLDQAPRVRRHARPKSANAFKSLITNTIIRGKRSFPEDRLAPLVMEAVAMAGVFPVRGNNELEQLLRHLKTALDALPDGPDKDALRANYAAAHDHYAEVKFGKSVSPKKLPPPASAEQIAAWEAEVGI